MTAHKKLYERVEDALQALPLRFSSTLNVVGIELFDLFTLNTALGASIEKSVVENLNGLRTIWDPNDEYAQYRFVRYSQAFPDVRLEAMDVTNVSQTTLIGIELKGWFLLSKEGVPSFRYTAAEAACTPHDLIAIYPWAFSEVISGSPRLLRPFVMNAQEAARKRNEYWESNHGAGAVQVNTATEPYPPPKADMNDRALKDSGGNFGRLARTEVMKPYVASILKEGLAGASAQEWIQFLKKIEASNPS